MEEIIQNIPHWLQNISFFILSMFKSYSGPSLSALFNYNYSEMLLINFSASFISILISYRFRHQILGILKKKNKTPNGYSAKLKKMLILWRKYGFIGIVVLSPILISIPLGVIISAHFRTSKTQIFTYMFLSTFLWTNIFYLTTKFGLKLL